MTKQIFTEEQKIKRRANVKKWREENKEKRKEYERLYDAARKEKKSAYDKEFRTWEKNPTIKERQKNYRREIKLTVMVQYGGKCACCGETELEFLTIDHIDGGGTQHRKRLNTPNIYRWLMQNNFPPGFQVLCMNCNFATRYKNICPHKRSLI